MPKGEVVKLSPRDHVLTRPDMHVGSVIPEPFKKLLVTPQGGSECFEGVAPEALPHILREVVANAIDASIDDPTSKCIESLLDPATGTITVKSNTVFAIVWRPAPIDDWAPAAALSQMHTSTNYDDDQVRYKAGRNGAGGKIANIFSDEFVLDVGDPSTGQRGLWRWVDNLSKTAKASVTSYKSKTAYVKITFTPDYKRFKVSLPLSPGVAGLLRSVFVEASLCAPPWTVVKIAGDKIPIRTTKDYVRALVGNSAAKAATDEIEKGGKIVFDVSVCLLPESSNDCAAGASVVFVNGAPTVAGTAITMIYRKIADIIASKKGAPRVSPAVLRTALCVTAKVLIPNPAFSSQTKVELKTPESRFGFQWTPAPKFVNAIHAISASIVDAVKEKAGFADDKKAKKELDSGGGARLLNIPKYEPANLAHKKGGGKGRCSLILTEGDSAKTLAMAGRSSVKSGSDIFGIYPLRGKVLNTFGASWKTVSGNVEVGNVIKILGLTPGKKYDAASAAALPYRHLTIFADQDDDGHHIAGLAMLIVQSLFPSLLVVFPDFLQRFATPLVRIASGKYEGESFFTEQAFKDFVATHPAAATAKAKRYKGLGTSDNKLAKEYFQEYDKNVIVVRYEGAASDEAISLAFNPKRADDRKEVIRAYDSSSFIDYSAPSVSLSKFIKVDVFSYASSAARRAIPALDGLKDTQRKIVWHAMRTASKGEVKVAQFGASCAEASHYAHGEVSLIDAVTRMASTYCGSSNVSLLVPSGQFGSRHTHKAAAPRYIFTQADSILPLLFPPEDGSVLEHATEDGFTVEPVSYVPAIPFLLVNGAEGIGTGFSTSIPSYNPYDLIDLCTSLAEKKRLDRSRPLVPWSHGWKGKLVSKNADDEDAGWVCTGVFELDEAGTTLSVTELPIGVETDAWLASVTTPPKKADVQHASEFIKSYVNKSTNADVHYIFQLAKPIKKSRVVSTFKLSKSISTSNMHAIGLDGTIERYDSPLDIVVDHSVARLALYETSRLHQLGVAKTEKETKEAKKRYISMIAAETLKLNRFETHSKLGEHLVSLKFPKRDGNFSYLTGISTGALTKDNVAKLEKEISDIEEKIAFLEATTPNAMWKTGLARLRDGLDDYFSRRIATISGESSKTAGKKRKGGVE